MAFTINLTVSAEAFWFYIRHYNKSIHTLNSAGSASSNTYNRNIKSSM